MARFDHSSSGCRSSDATGNINSRTFISITQPYAPSQDTKRLPSSTSRSPFSRLDASAGGRILSRMESGSARRWYACLPSDSGAASAMYQTTLEPPLQRGEWLTVSEAANVAGVAERTMRAWCRDHRLGIIVGGRWRVSKVKLMLMLAGNSTTPTQGPDRAPQPASNSSYDPVGNNYSSCGYEAPKER